jgi:hypothetical protein
MKHIARKRFGQHFLTDRAIIDAIVDAIGPQPGDAMVEIGPGLAAMTQPLVERLGHLTVIELDRDLAARLRSHGQLEVIESDVLKVDFTVLASRLRPEGRTEAPRRGQLALQHLHTHTVSPARPCGRGARPALHAAKRSDRPHGGQPGFVRLQPPVGHAAVALRHGQRVVCAAREL